jgi:hypothetical protein
LVQAAFAVVSTHQSAQGPRGGYGPFSLGVIHKKGLCSIGGDINRLVMMKKNRTKIRKVFLKIKAYKSTVSGKRLFIYTML